MLQITWEVWPKSVSNDADVVNGLTNLSDVMEVIEHDFANACDGGYIVVPEILGNKNAKYQNHALWLTKSCGIVNTLL